MVRTQISLELEEIGWLKRQAKKEGTSLADILRRLIRHAANGKGPRRARPRLPLHEQRRITTRFPFVGCIKDGPASDAKLVDDYLYGEGEVR
ncbi:MAG: ribbon-helix-helix protein, CopG family [Verrucomicrobiota bacterium]|nr:ribbon-helix-helix protein, CopG family [Verrucomicrobiota bacterium]